MKWQSTIPLLFLPFIFSCKKETEQADRRSNVTNPTDYLLVSQTWTGPTTDGLSYTLSYNNENLLSDAVQIQWAGGSTANGDTTYYHFEYSGSLCREFKFTWHGSTALYIYEYNAKGLPTKVILNDSKTDWRACYYEYDPADHLIKIIDSGQDLNFTHEFSYNDQGNPSSYIYRDFWANASKKTEWPAYDDKVNYARAVNGLPPQSILYENSAGFNVMRNNALTFKYTSTGFINSTEIPYVFQDQLQYNDQGLPTQITSGPWIITNTYVKFK